MSAYLTSKSAFFLLILSLLIPLSGISKFFNSWINYSQNYYKIKIARNGICTIGYKQLRNAGFPLSQIAPDKFQIWRRGKQVAIYLKDGNDGIFDPGDQIIFYAKKNNGALDTAIYKKNNYQVLPEYSLYTDTAAYFLTYNNNKGKRITSLPYQENNDPIDGYWLSSKKIFTKRYNNRKAHRDDPKPSYGENGEGWVSKLYRNNKTATFNIDTIKKPVKNKVNIKLFLRLVGRSTEEDRASVILKNENTDYKKDLGSFDIEGMKILDINKSFNDDQLLKEGSVISLKIKNLAGRYSIAKFHFKYLSKNFLDGNQNDSLFINKNGNYTIKPRNYVNNHRIWDISDFHNQKIVNTRKNKGNKSFTITYDQTNTKKGLLYYSTKKNQFNPAEIKKIQFRKINPDQHNYFLLTHETLMEPSNNEIPVYNYARYRASKQGGNHDTLVMKMKQLYNQFSFGDKTPVAIREFARYMLSGKVNKQRYLFLLGQGLLVNFKSNDTYYRDNPSKITSGKDLIPTMGFPPSDALITADLRKKDKKHYEAAIPTSRLPAKTPNDVAAYLEKVKTHESINNPEFWRKNLLFISGGRSEFQIKNYEKVIKSHSRIAENSFLGANGSIVAKNTPGNTRLVNISKKLNRGLSIIETFGHTTSNYYDVNIGNITNPLLNYNNKGKYPFLYVNGCSSGNAFINSSLGENWMLTPEKGAIAFLAHADLGFASVLKTFGDLFYKTLYEDSLYYGKPLSKINQITKRKYLPPGTQSPSDIRLAQTHQMILQGDPAIRVYTPSKPDYKIKDAWLSLKSYNNENITARSDSFAIKFIVKNPGKFTNDSLRVSVERIIDNSKTITYPVQTFGPVKYSDTLLFKIKQDKKNLSGNNIFKLFVDAPDSVKEFQEFNNVASISKHLIINQVKPIFPDEFSIVNKPLVNFTAQSTDITSSERAYQWEIDTSHLFNSPVKMEGIIKSNSLIEFQKNLFTKLPLKDSTVFYWRVKYKNPRQGEATGWNESSFIFIEDSPPGWAQKDYFQFEKNSFNGIQRDTNNRKYNFNNTELLIDVETSGSGVDNPCDQTIVNFNNINIISNCKCAYFGYKGIYGYVFDNSSLKIKSIDISNNKYFDCSNGNVTGVRRFVDMKREDVQNKFKEFLNKIPENDYILLFTSGNAKYDSWPESLKNKVAELGSDSINKLNNGEPFLFLAQKGNDKLVEVTAKKGAKPKDEQNINLNYLLKSKADKGFVKSTTIGPVSKWGKMFYNLNNVEKNIDKWSISILGINNGKEKQLYKGTPPENGFSLKKIINAKIYPEIKLKATLKDTSNLTPPQPDHWIITYEPLPEGIIDIANTDTSALEKNKIMEGQKIPFQFAFKNISQVNFQKDSLLVNYNLSYPSGVDSINQKIKAPERGKTVTFNQSIKTLNRSGENSLRIFVNPYKEPELNYNNNILELSPYKVFTDNKNPIMEVTFDGKKIMDGEIISPNPRIVIRVKDDNPYLQKQDTSGINLFIKNPCSNSKNCDFERIPLKGNPHIDIKFPENPGQNLKIIYKPENLRNGIYNFQANAADARDNKAGNRTYSVNFEVVNEASISNFHLYPNPFSRSTRFVFTITGDEIPDKIKLRIITATGKVVREFSKAEMGTVRTGKNEFIWNGTDELGNKLSNGIYFYQVKVRNNGEKPKKRNSAGDESLKKGMGKIFILR